MPKIDVSTHEANPPRGWLHRHLHVGRAAPGSGAEPGRGGGVRSAGSAPRYCHSIREGHGTKGDADVWLVWKLLRANSKWCPLRCLSVSGHRLPQATRAGRSGRTWQPVRVCDGSPRSLDTEGLRHRCPAWPVGSGGRPRAACRHCQPRACTLRSGSRRARFSTKDSTNKSRESLSWARTFRRRLNLPNRAMPLSDCWPCRWLLPLHSRALEPT